MGKKGKEKATAPPPQASGSGSSSKKSSKSTNAKSSNNDKGQDDSFIVFTNSNKDPKPKKGSQAASNAGNSGAGEAEPSGPPKPTVKQLIGGASWTGKLPVNLLSEHCQRQKWDRPDYQPVRNASSFAACPAFELYLFPSVNQIVNTNVLLD